MEKCVSFLNNHPCSCAGSSAGITEGFSMCGGDFVEVYSHPSQVGMLSPTYFSIFMYGGVCYAEIEAWEWKYGRLVW